MAQGQGRVNLNPGAVIFEQPQRWDIEHPWLYSLVSEVLDSNNKVVDRYMTPFGIRTIEFDKAKGRLEKAAGDLLDDDRLRDRGTVDETAGKVKDSVERGVNVVRDTVTGRPRKGERGSR